MAPPPPAPRGSATSWLGILLGVSTALLVLLTGPLLLFNPWFVSVEQARNEVPARLQTSQAEVDRVTSAMLCDLVLCGGDFGQGLDGGPPLLTDAERSHMRDVGRLVRLLVITWLGAVAVAIASLVLLRRRRQAVGRALLLAGGLVGSLAVVLAAYFAIDFNGAFLAFHEVFFPQGNFLFGPDSNLLRLFPENFWFEVSLSAGIAIILSALAVILVGWRLWRREQGAPTAG
jgi:integral membrane protein (TIGR01906 family)